MTNHSNDLGIQVLRTIDKFEKLGRDGVVALLQKPAEEFGAALDPVSAGLIGLFLDAKGETNQETISNIRGFFAHAEKVRGRVDLMTALDAHRVGNDGSTAWEKLLAMPANDDETWNGGGRPRNIGWALDDIAKALGNMSHKQEGGNA